MHAWLKNGDQHHWCHSYCQSLRLTLSYLLLEASHPHPADAHPKVVALCVWPSKEFPSSEHVLEPLVHRPLPRELGTTLLTARASLDMLEMSHKVTIEVVQGGTPPGRKLGTDLVPTLGCDWLCWREFIFIPDSFNNVQFVPPNYTMVHTDGGTLNCEERTWNSTLLK